ncbi:hypothetical protein FKW77_007727 [Venturia effusa]|uniref:Uncharacterized protein n=1 Tax=Venturia effusa TaxID=50376 RepID=A0A517L3V0_9PEZI|nr:hypothetical protein FKW77_007727 [Venturia effusa]
MASQGAGIISEVIASQPPETVVEAEARLSTFASEKMFHHAKAREVPSSEYASESEQRDRSWDVDLNLYPAPTEEEERTLKKVAGSIPWVAYCLCFVEFAERASYYGATTVFANFLTYPLPTEKYGAGSDSGAIAWKNPKHVEDKPGALGKGKQFASAMVLLFKFLAYTFPIFGAWIAEVKIGRYRAILYGVLICGVAHIIQIFGALPSVLRKHQGLAPFLISVFVLAIGAGIFKPNILPTVLDQYRHQRPYVKTKKNGEKIIIDPEMTINRISLIFYCFVNIGAFFPVATVYAERRVGFWFAFLLPGILYFLLPLLLLVTYKKTYRQRPSSSALDALFKILAVSFARTKGRFWSKDFWTSAKPSVLAAQGITSWKGKPITWSDGLVHDVHRTVKACGLFFWFPVWYLNNGGIGVVANSQAGAMTSQGVPNDLIGNFNSLTIIVFIPILSYVIYPTLQHFRIMPGRITRITFGFTLAWISSVIGAITQLYVYRTSPCGWKATSDSCKDVSPLSVWIQLPMIMLGAISECFCQVTAYEIAYARSPKNMKAVVMSIFLFQNALSSAVAQVVIPAIKDPQLIWVWASPAICLFVVSVLFFIRYRKLNHDEFMTDEALAVDSASESEVEAPRGDSTSRSVESEKTVLRAGKGTTG